MKTTVESTSWASLRQASGTCEQIPVALEELCSPDERVRERGYWKIDNHVVLQGDLYEGAPFVARALVEILARGAPGRDRVYDLLIELAYGHAPVTMLVSMDGETLPVKRATVRCLLSGMVHYQGDLRAGSPAIRRRAVELLLALSGELELSAEALRPLVQQEPEEDVRALLEELMSELRAAPPRR